MTRRRVPRISLEQKLPVLIGGLVAVSLITLLALASHELRRSAVLATSDRLERINAQITRLAGTSTQTRAAQLDTLSSNIALRNFMFGDTTFEDSARTLLEPRGNTLAMQLRAADDRVLLRLPDALPDALLPEQAASDLTPRGAPTSRMGPFHRRGDRAVYWATYPVVIDNNVAGYIDQLRATSNPQSAAEIETLIGGQAHLYFAAKSGPWVTLGGEIIDTPPPIGDLGSVVRRMGTDGEPVFALAEPVAGTDWTLITELPVSVVEARPAAVVRRLLIVGLLLLVFGGVAAWLVSRSVTRPLRELAIITDAISAGDYSRRARLMRDDEIGRLAGSFDGMLQHIEASHDELGRRFEHAQALAVELERANQRLQSAMVDANTARTEAQQANRAKDEFLATMSHEIRTPINAMIGYTDLLDIGVAGPMQPRQQEFIERIRVSGQHLIAIVNDVLDFAKIESGQMRLERTVRPLDSTIQAAVSMLEARARARNISMDVHCVEDAAFVGDSRRVQQVLLNLLSNAVKFTEPGGRITIRCDRRESRPVGTLSGEDTAVAWTCVTVSDTGVGISPDQLNTIFEPFVQGTGGYTRPHGGTGLGLAISRSLAHMMSGDLTVESEPGAGASFTLWLPHPSTAAVAQPA